MVFVKYLGKKFESRKLFVTQIENALVDYYQSVVQYLKNWEKPAPKIQNPEVKKLPTVCGSLREAMQSLDKDRKFLTQGGVFTDDQIDAYIDLKFQEIYKFEHTPHPIEFEMYYSG